MSLSQAEYPVLCPGQVSTDGSEGCTEFKAYTKGFTHRIAHANTSFCPQDTLSHLSELPFSCLILPQLYPLLASVELRATSRY